MSTATMAIVKPEKKDALPGWCRYCTQATIGLAPKWTLPNEYAEAAFYAGNHGGWFSYGANSEVKAFIHAHGHEFHSAEDFETFLRIHRIEIV